MSIARGQPVSKAELENRLATIEAAIALGNTSFLSGDGDPAPATGKNGDHYLNRTNGGLFRKDAGAWVFVGEIWIDTTPVTP